MQITIDTSQPLSDIDLAVLGVLLGQDAAATPAPKAAAKPAKKAAAAKAEPEPEPEAEEDEGSDEPTLEEAVALATKLVSSGKSKDVKAALTDAGVKRVSELKSEDIPAFIKALS